MILNIGILCVLKYTNAAIESINSLFKTQIMDILVPLGLSYYTFKSVGYIIDVYRGRIKAQKNIGKLALYISYFPALVQGPIDRYEDLADQLFAKHPFSYQRLCFGAQRMLWGYIKKLVIAERAAVIVNEILGYYAVKGYEGFTVFFGMVLYMFQLYADFSGGMDIVIGLSEIFGISMTENFQRPFFAASVAEFWRRWHITLVGKAIPIPVFRYWRNHYPNVEYRQLYGPSEVTGVCTCYRITRDYGDDETIPIGRPFPNTGLFLLDENDQEITPSDIGASGEV